MAEINLTDENFEEEVLQGRMPVLVDFWAEWCSPCQMAAPVLEELAKEYGGKVKFWKLDVDASPAIAGKYGVMSVPTVILFKDGKEVGRKIGLAGKEEIIRLIGQIG